MMLVEEGESSAGEIEFPHPAEPLVVHRFGFLAVRLKPIRPNLQSFGIMQAQHFYIENDETCPLDMGDDFGKARYVATGKNVFDDPRAGRPGAVGAPDRMQERDAVVVQRCGNLLEELLEIVHAHMLEHSDRDDAVEFSPHVPVIL